MARNFINFRYSHYKKICMNSVIYFSICLLLFTGCSKSQNNAPSDDVEWNKIIFKDQISVTAFYGNINDQMIVGTDKGLFKTTDKGVTWKTTITRIDQVRKFVAIRDTIFGISLGSDLYSLDEGDSWRLLNYDIVPSLDHPPVISSENVIYKFVTVPQGENALPSKLLQSTDNGVSWKNIFPYNQYITSLYIDNTDKLYVGAWGAT